MVKNIDGMSKIELKEELIKLKEEHRVQTTEIECLKESFLTNISHEIRTPMNAIIGFSGLLRDQLIEKDKDLFVDCIIESGQKLLKTIDSIVQTSRIEANQIKIKNSHFSLNLLLEELNNSFKIKKTDLEKKHIALKLTIGSEEEINLLSDPIVLKQAIFNLLDNALKFTECGHIEFGYELIENEHIQFFIKDTGIGIPESDFNVIFEKFRQLEGHLTKKYAGLGVGLFNSFKLIGLLGGELNIKSTIGIGSKFSFNIPINTVITNQCIATNNDIGFKQFKTDRILDPFQQKLNSSLKSVKLSQKSSV